MNALNPNFFCAIDMHVAGVAAMGLQTKRKKKLLRKKRIFSIKFKSLSIGQRKNSIQNGIIL